MIKKKDIAIKILLSLIIGLALGLACEYFANLLLEREYSRTAEASLKRGKLVAMYDVKPCIYERSGITFSVCPDEAFVEKHEKKHFIWKLFGLKNSTSLTLVLTFNDGLKPKRYSMWEIKNDIVRFRTKSAYYVKIDPEAIAEDMMYIPIESSRFFYAVLDCYEYPNNETPQEKVDLGVLCLVKNKNL